MKRDMCKTQIAPHPTHEAEETAREIYGLTDLELTHLDGGRTHDTFKVKSSTGLFILQRLNVLFEGHQALGLNWHTVYQALEQRTKSSTVPMPPIFPDRQGQYLGTWPQKDNEHWRLTGYLVGEPPPPTAAGAYTAARLLGFCHYHLNRPAPLNLLALSGKGEFSNCRLTKAKDFTDLSKLYRGHPDLESIKPALDQAADLAFQLPRYPHFIHIFQRQDLIIHGDPKADNFLFTPGGQPLALLDWDTTQLGDILIDIAEMLRSWSTPPHLKAKVGEIREPLLSILPAVVEGYAETGLKLTETELSLLPPLLRALCLNLCRRYLTDALAQVYFQWDSQAYPIRYQQNLARATSLMAQVDEIAIQEIVLTEAFQQAWQRGLSRRPDLNPS